MCLNIHLCDGDFSKVGFLLDSLSGNLILPKRKEQEAMKGYNIEDGYMGYVNGGYQFFASEADYREWMEDM